MENENIVYGRLTESVHISGYSLERAMGEFKWLLEGERWKKVGSGYDDIGEFLNSLKLSDFKIAVEQRKDIAKKLAELKASKVATAKILGVDERTIRRDLSASAEIEDNIDIDVEDVTEYKSADAENRDIPNWINESGQKEVAKKKLNEEKEIKKEELKTERIEKGKKVKLIDIDFRLGNFIEVLDDIPNGSIDCIITDPPYPFEFIDCWTQLSWFAAKKLKPNGFCIAYSGQYNLPDVMERMKSHLRYYWTFAVYHEGTTQIVNAVNLMCRWKPVLIYQNGRQKLDNTFQDYFISEKREKDGHDWQQSISGVSYLIEMFTKPGDLICEPFAGSGTTIISALELKRNIIASEIDEKTYNIAKSIINDETKK